MEVSVFEKYADFDVAPQGTLPADVDDADAYFYLKPQDDAMAPDLPQGEPALFKKQRKAQSGDIVFAAVGSEQYIRKLWYDKDALRLDPIADGYEPLVFTGFSLNRVKVKGVLQQ